MFPPVGRHAVKFSENKLRSDVVEDERMEEQNQVEIVPDVQGYSVGHSLEHTYKEIMREFQYGEDRFRTTNISLFQTQLTSSETTERLLSFPTTIQLPCHPEPGMLVEREPSVWHKKPRLS